MKPTCDICLVVAEPSISEAVNTIRADAEFIDLAEIRADFLREDEIAHIDKLPSSTGVPLIFTYRRVADGGRSADPEPVRRNILAKAAMAGYRFVDLESDVDFPEVEAACRGSGCRIIRSLHDFTRVPENLPRLIEGLKRQNSDVPKAAVMPSCTADLVRLVSAFRDTKSREKIIIGMATYGFPTRVLAGKLGSMLTFCSPKGDETAPGHIDPRALHSLYHFRTVKPGTRVFCVIANPVMHSRSPHIHNPALRTTGQDAIYVPIQVDDLDAFFDLIPLLDIAGVSVTVPHKESVRRFLSSESGAVDAIGSCNTVYRHEGKWCGENTDAPGFITPLLRFMDKESIGKSAVTVIGAGGTSRAVVYALRKLGARVCILNRTEEKAAALAEEFGCVHGGLTEKSLPILTTHSDVIVQTTNAGMHPQEDIDPLWFYEYTGREIVYDVIYAPTATKLLQKAASMGCRTLNGEQMLLEQAYLQFKLFTGVEYPEAHKNVFPN